MPLVVRLLLIRDGGQHLFGLLFSPLFSRQGIAAQKLIAFRSLARCVPPPLLPLPVQDVRAGWYVLPSYTDSSPPQSFRVRWPFGCRFICQDATLRRRRLSSLSTSSFFLERVRSFSLSIPLVAPPSVFLVDEIFSRWRISHKEQAVGFYELCLQLTG